MNNLLFLIVAQDYGLDWIDVKHLCLTKWLFKQVFMNNLLFIIHAVFFFVAQNYGLQLLLKINNLQALLKVSCFFKLCKTPLGKTGCLGNFYFAYWLPKHPVF